MAEYATRDDIARLRGQRTDPWFNDMKYVRKGEIEGLSGIIITQIASRPSNSLVPTDKVSYTPPRGKLIMNSSGEEYGNLTSGAYLVNSLPNFYDEWDGSTFIANAFRYSDTRYEVGLGARPSWASFATSGQYVVITDFDDDYYFYRFWYYQLKYTDLQTMDDGQDITVNVTYKTVPLHQ